MMRIRKSDAAELVASERREDLDAILVDGGVWESMKKAEAQALKTVVNLVSEARGLRK